MRLIVEPDAAGASRRAAELLERACAAAHAARGRACIAVSGGSTPWRMLELFAQATLPWTDILVAQVDERCAPATDPRRNLRHLRRLLVEAGPLPPANLLAMPVEQEPFDRAADLYAATLAQHLGPGLRFDLVQLGLGEDGHTASLVPGDPVLEVADRGVAVSQPYQGTRRMTLTYGTLDAARERLWLVTGAAKAAAVRALHDGTPSSPATRVRRDASLIVADGAAAEGLSPA